MLLRVGVLLLDEQFLFELQPMDATNKKTDDDTELQQDEPTSVLSTIPESVLTKTQEEEEEKLQQTEIQAKPATNTTRIYLIIAAAYLLFTITDGALRMLILFFAYTQGFSPLEIAIMFVLYECCGIVTNLLAGVVGSRIGLKYVLLVGLFLQLVSFAGLFGMHFLMQVFENRYFYVTYIALVQALSGIAKDSIKMSGKSLTKLSTKENAHSLLFKLVAFLTGAKNGMKGVGYFLGTLTLNVVGFLWSLVILAILIVAAFPGIYFLDKELGRSKSKLDFRQIFCKGWNVNFLSAARFFLFGSRDLWFEIALPLFLRGVLKWPYVSVGIFMAVWIIAYGAMQSFTPQIVLKPLKCCFPPTSKVLIPWNAVLTVLIFVIAIALELVFRLTSASSNEQYYGLTVVIIIGLIIFALLFAINSAIHSYLILIYTNKDKVAMNVGFYYMANAGGRMIGTLISGIVYNYIGLAACIWISGAFLVISTILLFFLRHVKQESNTEVEAE